MLRSVAFLVIGLMAVVGGKLDGAEPAGDFLHALRDNQYFDVALIYLDRLRDNPRAPADLRTELDYERGWTLVEAAAVEQDRAARERLLREAKSSLERFLQEQPEHAKRAPARRQYAVLLREWGRMKLEQARPSNDEALLREAAGLFDRSQELFSEAVAELRDTLANLPSQPDSASADPAPPDREYLRIQFLDSLLHAAEVFEDKAETAAAGSPERQSLLTEAAKRYGDMYAKYPERLAGVQARLNQARVTKKLGDGNQALVYLTEDLLNQEDDSPPVRRLKTRAYLLAMECWLDDSRREYRQAIERAEPWARQMRPGEEDSDPDWTLLRLQLAKAHRALADAIRERDAKDPMIKTSRDAARVWAQAVSRVPGEYQDAARQLLAELPGARTATRARQEPEAADFAAAQTIGTNAVGEMQDAERLLEALPDRLREETDQQVREELRQSLADAEQSVARSREEAIDHLRLALRLADAKTAEEDLNLVRRLLAFLYYTQGDYYDAAVLGEFVSRRFPGATGSQLSGQVALASYLKLYESNSGEASDSLVPRILSLANYIIDTSAGTSEAAEAIHALVPFLIRKGELDQARSYVERIPPDSPQRGPAELRIGEGLWREYLLGMNEIRQKERDIEQGDVDVETAAQWKTEIAQRKSALTQLRDATLQVLETGVERMRGAPSLDPTVPRAVLALAQIYVDLDQAPRAIGLLDDPTIGVLPMLERDDTLLRAAELREHAYRVALGAVVSALSKVEGTEPRRALIERSRQLMEALRREIGDAPESQQRLVEIFFSLAHGLETQVRLQERPEDRRLLSQGFQTFLDQVRAEANDVRVLNWVAQSYASLGSGLSDDAGSKEAAAKAFQSAVDTYSRLLDTNQPFDLAPEVRRQLMVRMAIAQRGTGQFAAAADVFAKVLADDHRTLDYQVEAAMTYQLWGAEVKEARRYLEAIRGTRPDPKTNQNIVWGWSRIARVTQRYPQHRDTFHQARFNTAYCHYKYALRLRQQSDQQKYLTQARNDIEFTRRLYTNMGGNVWWDKYDSLLKTIQKALGERAVGLAGTPPQ